MVAGDYQKSSISTAKTDGTLLAFVIDRLNGPQEFKSVRTPAGV
jgi:hypothetical protein